MSHEREQEQRCGSMTWALGVSYVLAAAFQRGKGRQHWGSKTPA